MYKSDLDFFLLWSSALEVSEEVSGTGEAGWGFGLIVLVIIYEKKRSKCGAVGFLIYKKCFNPGNSNSPRLGVRVETSPKFQKITHFFFQLQMTWEPQL